MSLSAAWSTEEAAWLFDPVREAVSENLDDSVGALGYGREEGLVHVARVQRHHGDRAAVAFLEEQGLLQRVVILFAGDQAHVGAIQRHAALVDLQFLDEIGNELDRNDDVHPSSPIQQPRRPARRPATRRCP